MQIGEVAALLEESLAVWHLDGGVLREGEVLTVSAHGRSVRVSPPPDGAPFALMVTTSEKTRGVASLSALLRTVRNALDPEHSGSRLRLAAQGVLPP